MSGNLVDQFRTDVLANKLPQVSYIVAPEAYCEHPNWPANFGAWYISQFLDALTANPDVWSKTALLLTWDENDGFFDHIVPPTSPQSRAQGISTVPTINEIFPGNSTYETGPYGLGVCVPMLVISPWSKGGYVSSELFDHTSIIRFIEARYAKRNPSLIETNITPWRRAVAGDLTSAFDFLNPNRKAVALPSTASYMPPNQNRFPDFVPPVPANQSLPTQAPGTRPARPVPYDLSVQGEANFAHSTFRIQFANMGKTAVLQVRSGNSGLGPWTYTVGKGAEIYDTWELASNNLEGYDLSVHGPNGFLRAFKGSISGDNKANLDAGVTYDNDRDSDRDSITLSISNRSTKPADIRLKDAYSGKVFNDDVHPGGRTSRTFSLHDTYGWYERKAEPPQRSPQRSSAEAAFSGNVDREKAQRMPVDSSGPYTVAGAHWISFNGKATSKVVPARLKLRAIMVA
jgi:phospholipase C